MSKPKAIEWLESQTGQVVEHTPEAHPLTERHLSVRLGDDLFAGLADLAAERSRSVSQLVRELLVEAVAARAAIAALDSEDVVARLATDLAEVRRRLAG